MADTRTSELYDVVVVGAGNAAFSAAVAARQKGARVLMLECSGRDDYTQDVLDTYESIRFPYNGAEDVKTLAPDLTQEELDTTDFGTYTEDQFFDDMFRITQYRADPELVEVLVRQAFGTMKWMREAGIRFVPIYGRQAFKVDGRFKFSGSEK